MKRPFLTRDATLVSIIFVVAAAVRIADLGGLSYWYDEVVTVRLAGTAGPRDLLRLLGRIDATARSAPSALTANLARDRRPRRDPGRLFSVACDLLTIVFIGRIARKSFGKDGAFWACWLAAISPNLVSHAREARMYAFLTLAACISWMRSCRSATRIVSPAFSRSSRVKRRSPTRTP